MKRPAFFFGYPLRRRWVGGLLLVAAVLFSFWYLKLRFTIPPPPPPMAVMVKEVERRQLGEAMRVLGEFVPLESQQIVSRVSAPVKEIRAEIGDRVKKGEPLAVLDDTRLDASRLEAEARLAMAEQNLERIQALKGSPAYSTALLEDRLQERDAAAAAVANAAAAVDWAVIRAPYDGTVTRRYADVEEWLSPGEQLFSFVNTAKLELEVKIPPAYFAHLKVGADYDVFSVLGQPMGFAGLRAVVPQLSPTSRTRIIRLEPQFVTQGIAANEAALIELPATEGERVVVAKDAVITEPNRTYVFVVTEDAEKGLLAEPRDLELGPPEGNDFVVISGLSPGERVVVRGNERIIPYQVVRIKD